MSEKSESSGSSETTTRRLYRDRPEWQDVKPERIDQLSDGVLKISYTEAFKDCFGYLCAVIKSEELSERVFELTTTCADENPACYTVWVLRRKLLEHLKKDLHEEMDFMSRQIFDNQKNYQVWYHRQRLVQLLQDPSGELEFIDKILLEDAKNYHAWQYRQWLLKTFNLWDDELNFCTAMLKEDIRNNSVWNQRYFVLKNTTNFHRAVVEDELKFTLDRISQATCNESAWNYLGGMLSHADKSQQVEVQKKCESMRADGVHNIYLYATLLSIYESAGMIKEAQEIVSILRVEDIPRSSYWTFRQRMLTNATTGDN
ncbi:protein farnesyltransferase/geranylgeranyltransferase type-1 subunit alpha-like [Tropilaelaps mercedesae]|uniref:Protein farnesyltransferase/geranylgeranyltransferase type-1 subunit alpha n=1 Tax=Tropilaelaps mercedesae TaxID=418985 RepID=A0A1V9XR19_9ACAR|nr:protein farnesyltransferase/geranylgeranyltransferase type-1 subunit alpha-like [Tropilaelaps mercedesae]